MSKQLLERVYREVSKGGALEPLWNLFDLTREGRPADWDEQLSYQ